MEKTKKGIYQVRRIKVDCRSEKESRAETELNSALLELQQDNNVDILDVIETTSDKSIFTFIIKYRDLGLE